MVILSFIFGVFLTIISLGIVSHCKDNKPKNKVHFYVARDKDDFLILYLGKPFRCADCFNNNIKMFCLLDSYSLKKFGLNKKDFQNLKWEDEPVEVFLNLED